MRNKLRMRDFPDRDIDVAMRRLVRLGLLDDTRFSESFVRERVRYRPMGREGLMRELVTRRGVSEEIARKAIAAVMDEEGIEERDLAMSVLRKRGVEDRRKIVDLLRRRGFGQGVISSILEEGPGGHDQR